MVGNELVALSVSKICNSAGGWLLAGIPPGFMEALELFTGLINGLYNGEEYTQQIHR